MDKYNLPEGLTLCFVHSARQNEYVHMHLVTAGGTTDVSATSSKDGQKEEPLKNDKILEKLPPLSGHIFHDAIRVSAYLRKNGFTECKTLEQSRWAKRKS